MTTTAGRLEPVRRWLPAATAILLVVAVGYLLYGSSRLFREAGDYHMRWVEQHYVFEGKNPLDVLETVRANAKHEVPPDHGRDATLDPAIGAPNAGYPPWAYVTGALFTWPSSFPASRTYYGILNLLFLAGLAAWAFRLGSSEDVRLGWFLAATLLAVNSLCTTLILGQYGIVVLLSLIGAYLLDEKGRWFAAGLCLAVAMTKVTLAAPFVLPFMLRGRWRMLFTAGAYLGLASLFIWHVIKTNPLEMLGQMARSSAEYEHGGYSLNNLLEIFGLNAAMAGKLAAVTCLTLAVVVLYLWRAASMLTHYAIVAVATRGWCYHALYDNLILVFLLVALGLAAWRTEKGLAWLSFITVGLTLWVPGRLVHVPGWFAIQWIVWVGGLAMLLYLSRRETQSGITKVGSA